MYTGWIKCILLVLDTPEAFLRTGPGSKTNSAVINGLSHGTVLDHLH